MTGPGPADATRTIVQRGFVAVRYVLGKRQPDLLARMADPDACAQRLAQALGHADRLQRARTLAADLRPIFAALERTRVTCR